MALSTDKPVDHPAYRPDVDGLRAVAVLSVLAFHAFPASLSGGFIGVDIFFVISGFLISSIIFGSLEKGSFSFVDFYGRRIKRIFPALILVFVASLLMGWLFLLPDEFAELGKHVGAGSTFVSNIALWREAGYFDSSSETKILLHLWSLGIEEQFYIVWPLLLFWLGRGSRLLAICVAVALVSFALNVLLVSTKQAATFYLPITRFWELMLGGMLAYARLHPSTALLRSLPARLGVRPAMFAEIGALSGALLIAAALVLLDSGKAFPGWWALLPTIGACMVIAAGPGAWLNRVVLSHRLMVWFGLISYPLYLWHWPLLSFARVVQSQEPAPWICAGLMLLAVGLAWLTYRGVEVPLRNARVKDRHKVVLLFGAMVMIGALGLAIFLTRGAPARIERWGETVEPGVAKIVMATEDCIQRHADAFMPAFNPERDFCIGAAGGRPGIVVVGDSHANRLFAGLEMMTPAGTVLNLGRGTCLPLLGYDAAWADTRKPLRCSPTMSLLLDQARDTGAGTIVISGFFARALDGRVTKTVDEDMAAMAASTLARLSREFARVIVVLDVPELPFDIKKCRFRPVFNEQPVCEFERELFDQQLALYEKTLRAAASGLINVTFYNPAELLCDARRCYARKDGVLLYRDSHHLSDAGARTVGQALGRLAEVGAIAR